MLREINLIRFKQFQKTKICLSSFSILMGENNCGKTSVLQAIRLALTSIHDGKLIFNENDVCKARESGYYVQNNILPISNEDLKSLFFARKTGGSSGPDSGFELNIADSNSNQLNLLFKELWGQLNVKLSYIYGGALLPNVQNYEPLYISGFVGINTQEERLYPSAVNARTATGNISAIVRNIVLDLKENDEKAFSGFKTLLKDEFDFDISSIAFDTQNDQYIKSEYNDYSGGITIPLDFSSSGSGLLQILQIVATIYKYCPNKCRVVLIDEPDAHLHNNLQVKFVRVLRHIQKQLGIQIILSTHSVSIIQDASPDEIVPISASEEVNEHLASTVEVQSQIENRLDAYELAKAKISGKLAFIEDEKIEIYEAFADAGDTNYFHGLHTIPVIRGRGKDDKAPFVIKDILPKLINKEISIIAIRDLDGMPNQLVCDLVEHYNKHGIKLLILGRYEIENYILSAEIFVRALEKDNPNLLIDIPSAEIIKEKITAALKDTIVYGRHGYIDTLTDNLYKIKHNLLGNNSYSHDNAKSEAKSICLEYEQKDKYEDLISIGMGKEALSIVFTWLNNELHLKLSRKSLNESVVISDLPKDLNDILHEMAPQQ